MVFLGFQGDEGLGYQFVVVLHESVPVGLEGAQALGPTFAGGELSLGGPTCLLQGRQLSPEFVEGDETLGGHILEVGALKLSVR